jgi:hypothetical protein
MTTSQCSRVLLRWRAVTALLVLGAFGNWGATAWSQNAASQERTEGLSSMQIPSPVEAEHHELHQELAHATMSGGKTAQAARALDKVLSPHFAKEEKYALPPLGFLGPLAAGKTTPQMRHAGALSDQLKKQLPEMLAEHQAIAAAAKQENKSAAAAFAEKLLRHAQMEEQVFYPIRLETDTVRPSSAARPRYSRLS